MLVHARYRINKTRGANKSSPQGEQTRGATRGGVDREQ